MSSQPITQEPLFLLFIAATVLVSLCFFWGGRRNKRIHLSAFNALVDTLNPRDQTFTTIGGQSGYHANLVPRKNQFIRRVDATITLLARHTLLYYPVSRYLRKWDRLFVTLYFAKDAHGKISEGHIIQNEYENFRASKITNKSSLKSEQFEWGGKTFTLYYQDQKIRDALLELKKKLDRPGDLRHVAFVPDQEKAFVFMVPRPGETARVFPPVWNWINEVLEKAPPGKSSRKEAPK
ncbi:MAG: hypothetical protein ACLFN0_02410 [Thermovirgaceae bacterium]